VAGATHWQKSGGTERQPPGAGDSCGLNSTPRLLPNVTAAWRACLPHRGAAQGEGLGNAFLSHISAVDGIFHVCRAFDDPDVTHVEDRVDPVQVGVWCGCAWAGCVSGAPAAAAQYNCNVRAAACCHHQSHHPHHTITRTWTSSTVSCGSRTSSASTVSCSCCWCCHWSRWWAST
jgi:hypothetical protein